MPFNSSWRFLCLCHATYLCEIALAEFHSEIKCYRDVDKQPNGLVLFGTQPSSHVKVRILTRAWLERYIHVMATSKV